MPVFVRTVSLSSTNKESKNDDNVNAVLESLQELGANIRDVKLSIGGAFGTGVVGPVLIIYEAPARLDQEA